MRTKILSFARRWWFMAVALALTTLLALLLQNGTDQPHRADL